MTRGGDYSGCRERASLGALAPTEVAEVAEVAEGLGRGTGTRRGPLFIHVPGNVRISECWCPSQDKLVNGSSGRHWASHHSKE